MLIYKLTKEKTCAIRPQAHLQASGTCFGWLALHFTADVAFNKSDDESFEPWMESLQPTFSGIGRQTNRNDCVAKFERAKIELRIELQSLSSRICFTSDLWTSNQKLGYLCVIAHYIGPDFF